MFRAFFFIAFMLSVVLASAQQDQNFSQYMNNPLMINPGYAGTRELVCLAGVHRQSMVGLNGAPSTSVFSANLPISVLHGGVGLSLLNDAAGNEKNLGISGVYAYSVSLKDGLVGIGLNIGFINASIKSGASWTGNNSSSGLDPLVPTAGSSAMSLDLGVGVYYRTENLYFGVGATHLTQPEKKFNKGGSLTLNRYFNLTCGYAISLPNPQFEFQPSVFIGSTMANQVFDLNGMLIYNKRIWGGISYRLSTAVVGMVGIVLKNDVRIGYSYDFNTNGLSSANSGTHEISLGYNFSLIKEKIPRKYKSVRFL
jgi:type IX secretion system PorP/SprF family membrane protein